MHEAVLSVSGHFYCMTEYMRGGEFFSVQKNIIIYGKITDENEKKDKKVLSGITYPY